MTRADEPVPGARRGGRVRRCLLALVLLVPVGCATAPNDPVELGAGPLVQPAPPGTVELAREALADARHDEVRSLLDRVLLAEPGDAEALLLAAELRLALGATEAAAEAFGRLTGRAAVSARAHQGRGIGLLRGGARGAGYQSLRAAVAADPALWRAWNALGSYYDGKGDWPQAARCYAQALALAPELAAIRNNLGFSLLMQGRLEEAVEVLEQALALDPDSAVARGNLRLALAWRGDYVQALSGAAEADMAAWLNNVGFVALLRGDHANAEAYLLRAMDLDPRFNEVAAQNLAYLRQARGLRAAAPQAAGF